MSVYRTIGPLVFVWTAKKLDNDVIFIHCNCYNYALALVTFSEMFGYEEKC